MVTLRSLSWRLAAALLAVSCTAENPDTPGPGPAPHTGPLTSIGAGFEQEEESGKTWMTYDLKYGASTSAPKVLWATGDKINVFASDASTAEFTLKDGDSTQFAHFDGYLDSYSAPYYAFYPHWVRFNSRLDDGKLKFTLPQLQYASMTASNQIPAIAYIPSADANTTFRNICGLLRMGLTSTAGVTLGKIEIIALGGEMLWGEAAIKLDSIATNVAANQWKKPELSGGDNKLILDFSFSGNSKLSSSVKYFYAALPPHTLSKGVRMIFYDSTNNAIDEICTGANLAVERAHVLRISDIEVGVYTLLDLDGNANCYIADRSQTSKKYKFCTFMGNSGDLVPHAPDAVEELWETQNGSSTFNGGDVGYLMTGLTYYGGCISFTPTNQHGNALIATKKSGTIMWSWHIWMPYGGNVPSVTLGNGTVCQDRNLGSLYTSSNTGAMGLLYQYARKDPFTAPHKLPAPSSTDLMVTSPADAIKSYYNTYSSASTQTIAWTIQNPTMIIDCTTGKWDTDSKATWRTSTGAKSLHDPCPPGWKVPEKGAFDNLSFGSWDASARMVQETSSGTYFSGTGRRYLNGDGNKHLIESSANSYYWTTDDGNTTSSNQAGRYCFEDPNGTAYYLRNAGKRTCLAVRCVAEQSEQ